MADNAATDIPSNQDLTLSEIVLLNAECFSSKAQRKQPIAMIVILILVEIASPFLMFYGFMQAKTAYESNYWSTTKGIIVSSKIDSSENSSNKMMFSPAISYNYKSGGKPKTGSQIKIGESISSSNKHESQKIIDQYPLGKRITVHYDPSNPDNSVLEPGIHFVSLAALLIGSLFFLVCGFNLNMSIKQVLKK